MLTKSLLTVIEIAINRYIGLDPHTQQRLQQLAGNYITIECTGLATPFIFQLQLTNDKIRVLPDDPTVVPTTYIKGTPLALCRLGILSTDNGIVNQDIEISGDIELGQTIKTIFDNMDIDWEGHLANGIGDVAAHAVGNAARRIKRAVKHTVRTTRANVSEYVTEEIRITPTHIELTDFLTDVDNVRDDTARLIARITHLENQLQEVTD